MSNVPWHTNQEHDCLPNLLKCCKDSGCEPECLCDESKCIKPCRKCDRDGTKEGNDW